MRAARPPPAWLGAGEFGGEHAPPLHMYIRILRLETASATVRPGLRPRHLPAVDLDYIHIGSGVSSVHTPSHIATKVPATSNSIFIFEHGTGHTNRNYRQAGNGKTDTPTTPSHTPPKKKKKKKKEK